LTDEYRETKVRVYEPKRKKDENIVTKLMVKPMMKMVGMKEKDHKQNRLTA
jgi:hypothetical protein